MKGKYLKRVFILGLIATLFSTNLFAGATTINKANDQTFRATDDPVDHITSLYAPWNEFDHDNSSTGNAESFSSASESVGGTGASCDVWGTGEGHAEGFIKHWYEWECPVENINGIIDINYKFSGYAEVGVDLVGWARARLWLTFFVDDDEYTKKICDKEVEWRDYKKYDEENIVESWSKNLTLERKTYNIGVMAFFKFDLDMNAGAHTYGSVWFANGWNTNDNLVTITWENRPPQKPNMPIGASTGKVGQEYSCTGSTTDPDGDKLLYWFEWKDGNTGWIGIEGSPNPINSGEPATGYPVWNRDSKGQNYIKVKAKDEYGAESTWSESLSVYVDGKGESRTISRYSLVINLLQKLPFLSRFKIF
jgi:hypothetical protein